MDARHALLTGVNVYKGSPENSLRGCVYDVEDARRLLLERGWPEGNITMLLDAEATKAAEVAALRGKVSALLPVGTLLWWRSSHGTQVPDADGDERDGKDEAVCCHDSLVDWPRNLIVDDELAPIFAAAPRGAAIIVVLDCCHSGTSTRDLNPGPYRRPRFLPPPGAGGTEDAGGLRLASQHLRRRRLGRGRYRRGEVIVPSMVEVLVSGCRSDQTSADTVEDGSAQGALSWALKAVLRERPGATLRQAHAATLTALRRGGYEQVSQLEGSEEHLDSALP